MSSPRPVTNIGRTPTFVAAAYAPPEATVARHAYTPWPGVTNPSAGSRLAVDGYVTPGHGVYACRATTASGETHAAATNIGVRPMFETGRGELIEAYLLDFDGDIYGEMLRLAFLKRLRGEKRFESVDALVEQMGRDVDEARAIAG